jgi:hypothetical protein
MAPMKKLIIASAIGGAACANTAEVHTSNLNGGGGAFDNLKASWGKALNIGSHKTNMNCKYDYSANKDFLKEVSFSGDLTNAGDVSVGYEVTRDFKSKDTEVKLTAASQGTQLSATYNDNSLQEVGAERDVDIGDQKVNVSPSWLVQAKTARVKLMSRMNGGDRISAQVDYNTDKNDATYEVGYDHNLEEGRDISATIKPNSKEVEIDYVDNKFENGATWTASASVPLENSGNNNILDAAKLTLKRSWQW